MICYEVAVAAPLFTPLTYAQPVEYDFALKPGVRVLAPLGNRLVTGYILGPTPYPEVEPGGKKVLIKPIVDLLDQEPLFPEGMIPLFRWLADYYHCPLGEVIRTALPGGITATSGRIVRLSEKGSSNKKKLAADEKYGSSPWMQKLLDDGILKPGTVAVLWRNIPLQRRLKQLEQQGLLIIEQVLNRETIRTKTEKVIALTPELFVVVSRESCSTPEQLCALLQEQISFDLGKAEQTLLHHFSRFFLLGSGQPVSRRDLSQAYAGTGRILPRLVKKKVLHQAEQQLYRDPFGERPLQVTRPEQLTGEQERVLAVLLPAIEKKKFQPFLLFGVTGSGKTEVYLQATEKALAENTTVLVLVPEIALASQVEGHFYGRFGDRLGILHSGLSAGQRLDVWNRVNRGELSVVIGARSAIFAPLEHLGLIIVDEEHESSYKQDDGLRYNARDVAVLRARFADCPVLLGSATPSMVSYSHTVAGKYKLLTMQRRVANQNLPAVAIVDLKTAKRSRPDLFFTDQLIEALKDNMDRQQQTLLFVNRRGYASFLLCRDCGHVIRCRHCHVSMTLHRGTNQLICHYCGYTLPTDILCPGCRSGTLVPLGLGSERIENEVGQILPHARIARLDSDTAGKRKNYLSLLKDVRHQKIDILIGTQMIAKGLHFPHVTLVGVVWADSGLNMPDYKATERTFSLLSQVTGRAGRGDLPGRVIIQTHQPEHYALHFASEHDYTGFYEQEISYREQLGYPPFSRLVNIRISGKKDALVQKTVHQVAIFLQDRARRMNIQILGPAPAPLSLLRDRYRYQLLLKGDRPADLHRICRLLLEEKIKICPQSVRLIVDIDPENMM